jgi:hypothetical protein
VPVVVANVVLTATKVAITVAVTVASVLQVQAVLHAHLVTKTNQ